MKAGYYVPMMIDHGSKTLPMFGRRLRQMRRALGVKQYALSEYMGVTQSTVSRWETDLQTPDEATQNRVFDLLTQQRGNDSALRRLVERSSECVHLVEEATHKCLAYSQRRAAEWQTSQHAMLGVSLWRYATDEIQQAEMQLEEGDWWGARQPDPVLFQTSSGKHPDIVIRAGAVLWERMYLSDGTPVRLCSVA